MSQKFPILFTVGVSNKHDVILVDPSLSISDLQSQIQSIIEKSPNCAEALSKYSKTKYRQTVKGIKVRWSGEPRDARLWPNGTILTEDNIEASLSLVSLHQGKDVLEVEVETAEIKEEGKKEDLPERPKE
ncbi:hypothetical protein BDZ85DRAFT_263652 [Elsinoe ampelina]|uniref:Uncharacterized protein n=2 Tax=Elsinoe TaxID=40996 RepID=A0A8K0PLT3_9PEZI|nr:hypothetical protein BDZ85DRAFT_263652 [Elsinoe ampelina]KAG8630299.1 hypothetical protein KVT40_001918 [Elsinoe batatas]